MTNQPTEATYHFNGFTLDVARRALRREQSDIALSPKEFLTLLVLVEAAGKAVPRETLIGRVWPDTAVSDNSLARNISALRRHLGAEAIEAVPKFGYRFALEVTMEAAQAREQNREDKAPEPEKTAAATTRVTPAATTRHWPAALRWAAWAAVAAVAVLSAERLIAFLLPSQTHADTVSKPTGPTWSDPQTRLTWARRDNGKDVTRQQAIAYCQALALAGYKDWRLPTIAEVQTLYDPSISNAGTWGVGGVNPRAVYWHVKGNMDLTGGTSASDLTFDGLQEQSFDFSYGRRNFDAPDFHADHRALCVRP